MKKILMIALSALLLFSCATTEAKSTEKPQKYGYAAVLDGTTFDRFDNPVDVDAEYYLIYYAADWCPYCKDATEDIHKFQENYERAYGNVAFVFAGHERDKRNQNMVDYLNLGEFDFPYVKMEYREKTGIMDIVDVPHFYVPGFILLDRNGNVLSCSNGPYDIESYDLFRPLRDFKTLQQCHDCAYNKMLRDNERITK